MASQTQSFTLHEVNLCNLSRWEHGSLGYATLIGSPNPKIPSMTWTPTIQHLFSGEAQNLLRFGSSKKLHATCNTSLENVFHEIIKVWGEPYFNGLKVQKLGLYLYFGTCWHEWDSGLHMNRPSQPQKSQHHANHIQVKPKHIFKIQIVWWICRCISIVSKFHGWYMNAWQWLFELL